MRLRPAATAALVAALLFVVFTLTSDRVPAFSFHLDLAVSMALGMGLLAVVVYALLPLRGHNRALLLVAVSGLVVAALGHLLDVAAVFDAGKVMFGAGVGFWLGGTLAETTRDVRWVVGVAIVVAAIDMFSVFSSVGVTNMILTKAPQSVPYFVVAFPAFGYPVNLGPGLGTSDMIFFALYLSTAVAFGLRPKATAAAMVGAVVVSMVVASWWRALPALPLMGIAFIAANADMLLRTPRPRFVPVGGSGAELDGDATDDATYDASGDVQGRREGDETE